MHRAVVADGGAGADLHPAARRDVHHRAVLHVGAGAHDDRVEVRAQHGVVPDARARADRHVADDPASRRDEGAGVDLRRLAIDADDADVLICHSSRPPMIFFQMRTGSVEA